MRKNMRLTYTRDGQDSFYSCKHLCTWLKTTSINNSTELGKKKKKLLRDFCLHRVGPLEPRVSEKRSRLKFTTVTGISYRERQQTRKIYFFLVAEGSGLISLANGSRDKSKNNVCKKIPIIQPSLYKGTD